ncbi:MAG TPA: hypothetical protein VGI55_16120 [Solirubrobacteraceae bacterium]
MRRHRKPLRQQLIDELVGQVTTHVVRQPLKNPNAATGALVVRYGERTGRQCGWS